MHISKMEILMRERERERERETNGSVKIVPLKKISVHELPTVVDYTRRATGKKEKKKKEKTHDNSAEN